MKWIGLTGPYACGKSTVARILKDHFGGYVIHADSIVHSLLTQNKTILEKIKINFGSEVFNSDGTLNKKKIAQIIFKNPAQKEILENIIHPQVRHEIFQQKSIAISLNKQVAFYEIPLLFEKKLESEFDFIVLIACTQSTQIARAKQRDNISEEEIFDRLQNQLDLKYKLSKSNYVIWNENLNLDQLIIEVKKFVSWLNHQKIHL